MTGWRTYLVSAAHIAFGVLATVDLNPIVNDPKVGVATIASGILMALMRSITSTPPTVAKK